MQTSMGTKQLCYTPLDYNNSRGASIPKGEEDELGTIRWEFDAATGILKGYRFCQVAANSANVANGTVMLYGAAGQVKHLIDSRVAADTPVNMLAGVGQSAITAGNRGWLQIYGPHNAISCTAAAIAVGDALIHSGVATQAMKIAAGSALFQNTLGWCITATNGNTVGGFIDCL